MVIRGTPSGFENLPKLALTSAAVQRLKRPKVGQVDHFDAGYPGLAIRISYGGSRTWVHFYRYGGKQRRRTLGRFPSMTLAKAREIWRNDRENLDEGVDPASTALDALEKNSFEAVLEEWLRRDQNSNTTRPQVERAMRRDVLPAWNDRTIASIKRRDVIELLDNVEDRGAPVMARRLHSYLHRMFRWSVGRGVIEANPMNDLPKRGRETSRERVLSDEELTTVWSATQLIDYPFGPAIQLLILTGARRQEIGALRSSEINDDRILLTGQRTKNGEPHSIPLSGPARSIIENLPTFASTAEFLFTTTNTTPVSGWSRAKRLLDRHIATTSCKGLIPKPDLPAWRLHDLRRTVATGLQRLGTRLEVIEAVLGHTSGSRSGIVRVYQRHAFETEKRDALIAWGDHICSLQTLNSELFASTK